MANEPELLEEVEPVQELHLEEYWRAVLKRWRLIALCVGVALTVAALYSILSHPLYKATVVLDVEPERPNPLDISANPAIYYRSGPDFLATQMKLMQTREIVERAVKRLKLVEDRQLNPPKSGSFEAGANPRADDELARVTGAVQGSITAKPIRDVGVTTRDTNLVELSAVAPSAGLATDIANAVADAYIAWDLESRYGLVGRASEYLSAQIQQTRSELDAQAQQLLAYGKEKDVLSTDPQGNGSGERMNYDAAVAERVAREARYHDVQTARPESIADTLAGGLVSQLRGEQARLEREYAEKLNLFKPDWPAMRQLKAQIDEGRAHLDSVIGETVAKARETARNDYLAALRREESFRGAVKSQKTETMRFNTDIVGYNNLKLEVDSKKSLLNELLKRQAELEVTSRLGRERESNVRVAERARPPSSPFRPSYKLNGLMALFLGGGFGVGLALLLEYLDRSLRTPEQVEQYIHLPALGVIPAVGAAAGKGSGYFYGGNPRGKKRATSDEELTSIELLPQQHPRSRVAERYRVFRTALLLSRAGGVKSIVITSSFSREGKTATAVNLAVVLGQLGKRVLLVDADLHRPRLHEIFRVSNRVGLVSILAENLDPDRAIANSGVPDVFVVPSGPSSPNPSGLLSSEAMSNFLEFARLKFDYVILDAPPVVAVADALVLGHQTDGVVLCIQGGKTPREHVARVRDKLLRSNVRILGVLINNVVEETGGYRPLDYDELYYGEKSAYKKEPAASATGIT